MANIREHPIFQIYTQGKDITALVQSRVKYFCVEDLPGMGSDRLTIDISDDGTILFPDTGTEVAVRVGWKQDELVYLGSYETSAPSRRFTSENGFNLRVIGSAAKWMQKFKQPKTRTWHNKTLEEIIKEIATPHGFTPAVDPAAGQLLIRHEDQRGESDINFLTRLARSYGIIAKPDSDETGYFFPFVERYEGRTASRSEARVILDFARKHRCLEAEHTKEARISYQSVKAYWFDNAIGENKPVVIGSGEPQFEITDPIHPNEQEAVTAAKSKLRFFKHRHKLNMQIQGEPHLLAGCIVEIRNFHREIDGEWKTENVRHAYSSKGGFRTSFSATSDKQLF